MPEYVARTSRLRRLLYFWKKESRDAVEQITISEGLDASEPVKMVDEVAAQSARDELRILQLQHKIVSFALTTIHESHAKGTLSDQERDQLLERYKPDLEILEEKIARHQRTVDLYELEQERKRLLKEYQERLSEIENKIKELRSGARIRSLMHEVDAKELALPKAESGPESGSRTVESDKARNETEKRIEAIREEVLRAMERLEQIESEA
jgi:hypothetical protein